MTSRGTSHDTILSIVDYTQMNAPAAAAAAAAATNSTFQHTVVCLKNVQMLVHCGQLTVHCGLYR
jgi:hypothetical protein